MKVGLLLASSPERPEVAIAYQIATESLGSGNDVYLYLVDDGVKNLNQPEIGQLQKAGIKIFACAYGAKKRNIAWDSQKAVFSGLTALVDIISACDEFLAFTPLGSSPRGKASSRSALPRTLITITEDPRQSHRPAEAIRIAAGIGSWKKTDVDILLYGAASRILSPYAEEFVDGENYHHYMPIIREWQRPVYLALDSEVFDELKDSEIKFQHCKPAQLEMLKQNATFFIPF